jgi:hypothetical protein
MDELALGLLLAFLLPLVVLGALLICFWKFSQVPEVSGPRRYWRLGGLLLLASASTWIFYLWLSFVTQPISSHRQLTPADFSRAQEHTLTGVACAGACLTLVLLYWSSRRFVALIFGTGVLLVVGGVNWQGYLSHHVQDELEAARWASKEYEKTGWQQAVAQEFTRQVERRGDLYVPALMQAPPIFPNLDAELAARVAALGSTPWQRLSSSATVQVAFIVEADGHLSLPHVIAGLGPGYDEAAVRIVQSLPRCQPATRDDGQSVAVVWQVVVPFPAN